MERRLSERHRQVSSALRLPFDRVDGAVGWLVEGGSEGDGGSVIRAQLGKREAHVVQEGQQSIGHGVGDERIRLVVVGHHVGGQGPGTQARLRSMGEAGGRACARWIGTTYDGPATVSSLPAPCASVWGCERGDLEIGIADEFCGVSWALATALASGRGRN